MQAFQKNHKKISTAKDKRNFEELKLALLNIHDSNHKMRQITRKQRYARGISQRFHQNRVNVHCCA